MHNTNLTIKATLLILWRCAGDDNAFPYAVLNVNLVITFHQWRALYV